MTQARRSTKLAGSSNTRRWHLSTLLVACLLLVNAVAAIVVQRFPVKLDLTDAKVYALSPPTQAALRELDAPIRVTVFGKERDYPLLLRETLDRYAKASRLFTISYRDPVSHPALVDSYMDRGTRIAQDDLVIESGDVFRRLGIKDLYTFDASGRRVVAVRAEQQITSAIVQLRSADAAVVRFVDGHDENPSKALMELFTRNHYQVARATLAVEPVGDAVDMLVIAAARHDLAESEAADIARFLDRGGSLMVFLAPSSKALPRLEALLARWGIRVGSGPVLEPRAHVSDNRLNIVPMYAQHPINRSFADTRSFLLWPSARALRTDASVSFDIDVEPVLSSTPEAYLDATGGTVDRTGPFELALTASRTPARAPADAGRAATKTARIFVAGSEAAYADDIMGMSNFANAAFMAQAIQWLRPEQQVLQIPAKKIAPDPLAITAGDAWAIGALLTGAIPVAVVLLGVGVAARRRRAR